MEFLGVTMLPDFEKAKLNKRSLPIVFLSIILVGIGLWLFHIDHYTYTYICSPAPHSCPDAFGTFYVPKAIPPPSYASLWPVFFAIGIGLMGFSVLIQIIRSRK